MSLPPPPTRVRITSAHARRRTGSSPTSKTPTVPSPITGRLSPEWGMGRVSSPGAAVGVAAVARPLVSQGVVASPTPRVKSRRRESEDAEPMRVMSALPFVADHARRGGAPLLDPAQEHGQAEPAEGEGYGYPSNSCEPEPQAAQHREDPAIEGVRAAKHHDVDHVLALVFLFACHRREQNLPPEVGDREIGGALDRLEGHDNGERGGQRQGRKAEHE